MIQGAIPLAKQVGILERLWRDLPAERGKLRPYFEKAKSYRQECGCALGGIFLMVALALAILDHFYLHQMSSASLPITALRGLAFAFGASILGKAIGIGIARIRLRLIYRTLRIRYRSQGA
jgi:hypothetical protein